MSALVVDTLQRLRDWPERLDALLRDRADWPFVWGVHDCCTFCADAVQAITGVDVMGTLRQRYHSAFEALGLTQELGGLKAAVSSVLGEPCSPALCTVGDVLLYAGLLAAVISALLGVPQDPTGNFTSLVRDMTSFIDAAADETAITRAEAAAVQMAGYFLEMIEEKRATPDDGLLSALIQVEAEAARDRERRGRARDAEGEREGGGELVEIEADRRVREARVDGGQEAQPIVVRGRDHRRAEQKPKVDRRHSDAASRSMHE